MKLITLEDIRDIYLKIIQRGLVFLLGKISISKNKRTKSSFNNININTSNWTIIPLVRLRWNNMITGKSNSTYEEFLSKKYKDKKSLKMLSIGSGVCSHELTLANLNPNWEITCIDFSDKLLKKASEKSNKNNLTNINFITADIYNYELLHDYFDFVFFHQSLHHFKNYEEFIKKINNTLKKNGKLIINEYVGRNRLQYDKNQLYKINQCLNLIDKKYRKIYKTNIYKNKYFGSGILRMFISDPSECSESENILPTIYKYYDIVKEEGFGGNLLMPVLKDISHHFINLNEEKKACLKKVFEYEDKYLTEHESDFVFGIYKLKNSKSTTANNLYN